MLNIPFLFILVSWLNETEPAQEAILYLFIYKIIIGSMELKISNTNRFIDKYLNKIKKNSKVIILTAIFVGDINNLASVYAIVCSPYYCFSPIKIN